MVQTETETADMNLTDEDKRHIIETLEPSVRYPYEIALNKGSKMIFLNGYQIHPIEQEIFSKGHHIFAQEVLEKFENGENIIALLGPMYSGKSIAAEYITQYYEKKGFKVGTFIAGSLGDSETIARSVYNKETGKYEETIREAKCINEDNYKEVIGDIKNKGIQFMHIDEATFLPYHILEEIISEGKSQGIKILITGLEKTMVGNQFPTATKLIENNDQIKTLQSYAYKSEFIENPKNVEKTPSCSETIRFFKYYYIDQHGKERSVWLRDFGNIFPVDISKFITAIIYLPARAEDSTVQILEDTEAHDKLAIINNPDNSEQIFRLRFYLEYLDLILRKSDNEATQKRITEEIVLKSSHLKEIEQKLAENLPENN